jgi:hypothetical protein
LKEGDNRVETPLVTKVLTARGFILSGKLVKNFRL